ncbi:MAG: CRISPR-associated endonuclease Cas2 [bacterium]|nr:CRISPR-associated endonuclease Cas2 [bacterium]
MHVLLIYDIVQDRKRAKVADACLDYGLDRVQYSAFTGSLSRTHQEELMLKIEHILDGTPARIDLFPIDEKAWRRRLQIEQAMQVVTRQWSADPLEEGDGFDVPRFADE